MLPTQTTNEKSLFNYYVIMMHQQSNKLTNMLFNSRYINAAATKMDTHLNKNILSIVIPYGLKCLLIMDVNAIVLYLSMD